MREIQTKSKSSFDRSTDPRKVTKKSLNPAFKAVSEDDSTVLEFLKEFPEVSVDDQFGGSAENFIAAYPLDTLSLKPVAISDMTSLSPSSVITSDNHVSTNPGDTKLGNSEVDSNYKLESYEAEEVIKHLRNARIQVLRSKDLGSSKKFLDDMMKIVIEEFYGGQCKDSKWLDKLASNKRNLVSMIVVMGIFAVFVVFWFFSSGTKGFVTGPPPT